MPFRAHPPDNAASASEVLIAALIFAIGFLGLAGLQARMLAAANSSYERSAAVMSAYTILDAMRAAVMSADSVNRIDIAAPIPSDWRTPPADPPRSPSPTSKPGSTACAALRPPRWCTLPACGRVTAIDADTFTYRVQVSAGTTAPAATTPTVELPRRQARNPHLGHESLQKNRPSSPCASAASPWSN